MNIPEGSPFEAEALYREIEANRGTAIVEGCLTMVRVNAEMHKLTPDEFGRMMGLLCGMMDMRLTSTDRVPEECRKEHDEKMAGFAAGLALARRCWAAHGSGAMKAYNEGERT